MSISVDIHKKATRRYYTGLMETTSTNYKYGMLFGGEPVSASEKARVLEEVAKVGSLTFGLTFTTEGWTAQCNEIPSIIAGNTNPDPNDIEIQSEIRAAIFATFDVKMEPQDIASPYQGFRYAVTE